MNILSDAAVSLVNARQTENGYTAYAEDPQFVLKPRQPIPAGWHRLVVRFPQGGRLSPQMFFDFGNGFRAVDFTPMYGVDDSGHYTALVKLPRPALLVRIDPFESKGDFDVASVEVTPVSRWALRLPLALQAIQTLLSDRAALTRRIRIYQALESSDAVIRLSPTRWALKSLVSTLRGQTGTDYSSWIKRHDTLGEQDLARLRESLAQHRDLPRIAVLMPVYNTPEKLLRAAIDSVIAQVHEDWELCIADDCSTAGHVGRVLAEYAEKDKRIRWVRRDENGHISHASNTALELVSADWVALLDHDDVLRPHALAEVALEIAAHPDAEMIYSDEDKLAENGTRYDPYFKPDFSRELFRSQNYLNHLTVHRAANIRAVGGWRPGFEGSQDYDLNLRIAERIGFQNIRHIPKILYHWRAVAGSTAVALGEKNYAYEAGFRALEEHVERSGIKAKVEATVPFYRLRFDRPEPPPLVSLIIPTRDRLDLLERAVGSILEKTTYGNFEIIIIDNGSVEPATLDYMERIAREDARVRVLRYDQPFNYSAINNFAVEHARGVILGLINNDIEVISPDWLGEMVSWAAQQDIGCVGAKLYYPNDTIQHAGVILGIGGVAGHSHKHFPRDAGGYFARLKLVQNLSAVTGACLLVRKAIFEAVGGLNETELKVAFNDVDLCLKVGAAGYLNVWTPHAELYHHESVSRGAEDSPEKLRRFRQEIDYMMAKWTLVDPYYSRHLTLQREDFSIAD